MRFKNHGICRQVAFQFSLKNRFFLDSWTNLETLGFFDDKDRILILALLMLNILKIKEWFNFLIMPP